MSAAEYSVHGKVAVITLNNPPVNGLGHPLRTDLSAGLERAAADTGIEAVVLIGAGNAFSGGADIREFNTPKIQMSPTVHEIIRRIEAFPKPVIAAIHKVAMGGGLELALGCHFRVAIRGTQIALPEVKLGLVPGAGGTQRLPRAIGPQAALEMIVSGNPVETKKAVQMGLLDSIIEGDLLAGAIAFAGQVVGEHRPLRRLRDVTPKLDDATFFFAEARSRVAAQSRGFSAPMKCLECVEAAVTLPFDDGLAFEHRRSEELVQTVESRALRHAFFGERAVTKIPDIPENTPAREIRKAAVIGAGAMGSGIAMTFANASIPVTLLEIKQEALERGIATILDAYRDTMRKGQITQEEVDRRMGLIRTTLSYDDIADADFVVEAVFEDLNVKKTVFEKLDQVINSGAILATNTSTLDVSNIAALSKRPQDVIGTHFVFPANIMRLIEIVRGPKTSKEVVATAMKLARIMRKVGVVSGMYDGFIGNRMLEQYMRQALSMLDEGALPQSIDSALEKWGMAMGPFAMSDLAGNDVGWSLRKRDDVEQPRVAYSKIVDRICEQGRFGRKTGLGWYRYDARNPTPEPDPAVETLIEDYRREIGITPRKVGEHEIIERCIFALVNEAARILEEGVALRAIDIDVIFLTGYGFPTYRGGPLFYADTIGLENVVAAMKKYHTGYHGECWEVAPLLARLAADQKAFN